MRILNYNPKSSYGPLCMDVAITSKCNYKCYFCCTHSYLKKDIAAGITMPEETVRSLFDDFRQLGVREILLSGNGEPLMFDFVRKLVVEFADILQIKALTNGSSLHAVSEELFNSLQKLTISLNSIDEQTHRVVHGYKGVSQLGGIIENIERVLGMPGARDKLQINYVMTADNYREFDELVHLSQLWDVPFSIRPISIGFKEAEDKKVSVEIANLIIGKIEDYLKDHSFNARAKNTLKYAHNAFSCATEKEPDCLEPCYAGFFWGNIWSNGDYSQCVAPGTLLGNIYDRSFKEIWQDIRTQEKLYAAILDHQNNKAVYPACDGCLTGLQYSRPFHKVFSRLPFQLNMLRQWRTRKNVPDCI